jgi:hypothetical protein
MKARCVGWDVETGGGGLNCEVPLFTVLFNNANCKAKVIYIRIMVNMIVNGGQKRI